MTEVDDHPAFRGTDDEFAAYWADTMVAPTGVTCWSCDREVHGFAYRVMGYERRRRSIRGWRLVCPPCYIAPAQNNGLRRADGAPAPGFKDFGDGHELTAEVPHPCAHCGIMVIVKPDARRGRHTCSEACRVALWRAEDKRVAEYRGITLPTCQGCGAEMDGRSDRLYCSPACRQRAYRERRGTTQNNLP